MGGQHATCSGSRAKAAAIYPFALCKAILQGIRNQLRIDHRLQEGIYGLMSADELQEWMENSDDALESGQVPATSDETELNAMQNGSVFKDALTGQTLDPELVKRARRAELEYFETKNVWFKKPRADAFQKMGKAPITVKWVDVNKGDTENPNYRSRLVAREIRKPWEDTIFAPTPPLESLRTVLSMAATDLAGDSPHVRDATAPNRTQVMVLDISRAYFNAKRDPDEDPTYVELPDEDPLKAKGMCGQLRVHMYGTRAAAEGWHSEYSSTMESMGFLRGDASACVFRHPTKRLVASVHGDDFTVAGPKNLLDWMKAEMEQRYELTETGRLGPGPSDGKEVKVLNRVVRWTAGGLEYEGDPRQSERFVRDLKLEGTKRVGTPGVKQVLEQVEKDTALPVTKHTAFRAATARGNYISADRPEIQFATKEICRWMAAPTELGVKALKRLGGYLETHKRLVFEYPFQEAQKVDVYSDTDWSGCIRTRKSTSGGCLMIGQHLIKSWSSTQGPISLSSGEAEFYGVVKASGMALGYQALLDDLGVRLPVRIWTDSSATMGICGRQGLGKLRHVDTRTLWVQQRVRSGELEIRKVRGEVNPADLFTKHLSSEERVTELLRLFGCRFADGRASSAPQLRRELGVSHEGILAVDVAEGQGAHLITQDGYAYNFTVVDEVKVPEAWLHDVRVLPHCVRGSLEATFPRALAGEELSEVPEREDNLEVRGVKIGKKGSTRTANTQEPGAESPKLNMASKRGRLG